MRIDIHGPKTLPTDSRYWYSFLFLICCLFIGNSCSQRSDSIRVGVFRVDISPPIGTPVAYAPARSVTDPLSARGLVFLSDKKPIVLCTVDWLGIANEGLEAWQEALALAAKTTPDRVSVHALHQHDGMRSDFTTERIMVKAGLGGTRYDTTFLRTTIQQVAQAVALASEEAKRVTHLGFGQAKVEKVASNRRILGPDGKVEIIRWSKSTDSLAIAAPEGLIDPWLKCVSFWNAEKPLAALTYYATHPQSYYGQGDVTAEFVGMARSAREVATSDVPHIHFNGAGGNITAGKYNDGSEAMRPILAQRMETGMQKAWDGTIKQEISAKNLSWNARNVTLPLGAHLIEDSLRAVLADAAAHVNAKLTAAKHLAWLQRTEAGEQIQVSALRLNDIWLLNLPGELFIEYQLAAQQMRPDDQVCVAAYEEYGPGYIGTEISYSQGGYETSERASRVGPGSEKVLLKAIEEVLTE